MALQSFVRECYDFVGLMCVPDSGAMCFIVWGWLEMENIRWETAESITTTFLLADSSSNITGPQYTGMVWHSNAYLWTLPKTTLVVHSTQAWYGIATLICDLYLRLHHWPTVHRYVWHSNAYLWFLPNATSVLHSMQAWYGIATLICDL